MGKEEVGARVEIKFQIAGSRLARKWMAEWQTCSKF